MAEFKKIEKHLYKWRHQAKDGQWSERYYAVFVDHQGGKHRDSLGDNLKIARDRLGELLSLNGRRFDFRAEKQQQEDAAKQSARVKVEAITFQKFGEMYFDGQIPVPLVRGKRPKRGRTVDRERELFKNLLPYFGDVPLVEITKARILAFSAERIKVPVSTGRRKGDKSPRNIGHELRFLRYLLNRGVDNDFLMAAPRIKVAQSGHRRNDLKQSEYEAMRKVMNPDAARYFAALWETGWRLNELRKLNWHKVTTEGLPLVDLKKGVLRLDAADVKEDYPRVTPISPELRKILLELKAGIASIDGAVFVRRTTGRAVKSIREAFLIAKEKAGCPNARPHDLRRSAIRRWEALGVSRQATMQASGHRPGTLHERYAELDEAQLLDAFQPLLAPRVKTGRQRAAILNGFKMKTHPLASDDRKTLTS